MTTVTLRFHFAPSRVLATRPSAIDGLVVLDSATATMDVASDVAKTLVRAVRYIDTYTSSFKFYEASHPVPSSVRDERLMKVIWGRYLTHEEVAAAQEDNGTVIDGLPVDARYAQHSTPEVPVHFIDGVRLAVNVASLQLDCTHWLCSPTPPPYTLTLADVVHILDKGYAHRWIDPTQSLWVGTPAAFFSQMNMSYEHTFEETYARVGAKSNTTYLETFGVFITYTDVDTLVVCHRQYETGNPV